MGFFGLGFLMPALLLVHMGGGRGTNIGVASSRRVAPEAGLEKTRFFFF